MPRPLVSIDRFDVLLPPKLHGARPRTLRQGVVLFSVLLAGMGVVFAPLGWAQGQPVLAAFMVLTGALHLGTLALLWRLGSVRLAGMAPGLVASASLAVFAAQLGGIHGTALYWSPLLVVVTLLLSGTRGALVHLGLQFLLVAAFVAADLGGVRFPYLGNPDDAVGAGMTIAILAAGTFGLVSVFVAANARVHRTLEERNAELRDVLENVGEAFLCADRDGRLVGDRSAATDAWFGCPRPGARFWAYLGAEDTAFAVAAELGWRALLDDVLPMELYLEQLPKRFGWDGRLYRVDYRPVYGEAGAVERLILVVTDITTLTATEAAEAEQRAFAAALDHAFTDRAGFHQFCAEIDGILDGLETGLGDPMRLLHTMKGNCAMFGADGLAGRAQALETRLAVEGSPLTRDAVAALRRAWTTYCERVLPVIGDRANVLELEPARIAALRDAVRALRTHGELDRMVAALTLEPAGVPLRRAGAYAASLARSLSKPVPDVQIFDGGVLLDPHIWHGFWAAFVHVVRNAVDHGLEAPERRLAAGKPPAGVLRLSAERSGAGVVIQIADNGGGVDWEAIARRARALDLPCTTPADVREALFMDGLSARTEVSSVSGRGVGMGAFRAAAVELGGLVEVHSERGVGTLVRVTFPFAIAMPPPVESFDALDVC
ncbi:MAG: ATP-binding protein [Pseudomonadota bacterium]|nr:ATP-binding protein [Pseudomonadota bacterium]